MATALALTKVRSAHSSEYRDLVALYQTAFPAAERKSLDALGVMLAEPAYRFHVAYDGAGFAGFTIARHCAGGEIVLLEYMAIVPQRRGQGLGRALFRQVSAALLRTSAALLIEVESDNIADADQPLRVRRKAFYRTLGAREIAGLEWVMPAVSAEPPPPMQLLLCGAAMDWLDKETLRQWLASIYVEVYAQAADDPRLRAMLATLPESIPLQ